MTVRTGVVVVHLSKVLIDEHLHKKSPPAGLRNVPLCDPVPRCWLKRLILVRIAFFFLNLQTLLCDVHTCEFTS